MNENSLVETLISRLDERVISGPITNGPSLRHHWRAVRYKTNTFDGVLLGCGHGTEPGPAVLRLGVKGLHRVWLGVFGAFGAGHIRARLTNDRCCRRMTTPERSVIDPPVIHEILWKECDLTDQDLVLEGCYDRKPLPGALAFIRLEPIQETAVTPSQDIWRPMAITNDGDGVFREMPLQRPEDILESMEQIPDHSCMQSLIWGNGNADNCNYPTKVGNPLYFRDLDDPFVTFDREITIPNVRKYQELKWDSLKLVREYTRSRKWELHVYIRVQAFNGTYPIGSLASSKFFLAHPEWWCRDREGTSVNRMSYAFPEVQDHMLSLIKEILSYEPDGICLCLVRGIPVMLYEPVMVEGFKKIHGKDPRELDELDPGWLDYQAEVFTQFMRRVKAVTGPDKRLSVIVPGNASDLRRWGLDVARWVRDGMIDDLYPVGQKFNASNTHYCDDLALDFDYFQSLPGRERIRLIPCLYTWSLFHSDREGFRRLVRSFLERGADQYCIWDGHDRYDNRMIGDIGFKDWNGPAYTPEPPPPCRLVNVCCLDGFRVDRYGHGENV